MNRKFITSVLFLLVYLPLIAQNDLKWSIVAEMGIGRYFFEAQPLDDHRVIIMGGRTRDGVTNSVQIYDARTKTVIDAPSMHTPRYGFTSLRLPDGRIWVSGGCRDSYSVAGDSTVEIYDPGTDTWSDGGEMEHARWQHSSVMIDEDKILIIGGWAGPKVCEVYSLTTRRSVETAEFPYISSFGKAAVTADGRILAFSGRSGGPMSYRTATVHRYDNSGSTATWVPDGAMSRKLYYPSLTILADGEIVLTGGSEQEGNYADIFASDVQIIGDTGFAKIGDLFTPRAGHETAEFGDGQLIVMGGMDNNKHSYFSCEWVDVTTGVVTEAPPMNETRRYFRAVTLYDDAGNQVVVAIGGQQTDSITGTIEELCACTAGETIVNLQTPTVTLLGSARSAPRGIQLTAPVSFESGAFWLRERLPAAKGFDVSFSFRMIQSNDNGQPDGGPSGADGVALILQNETRAAVGQPGDGIGYNGIPHGIAVEFDAYLNQVSSDPSASHIAVQIGDGSVLRPWHVAPYLKGIVTEGVPQFAADGTLYYARVVLTGSKLAVYCSTSEDMGDPLLTVNDFDVKEILRLRADGACYLGFTSSTGMSSQIHEVLSVTIDGCQQMISSTDENESEALVLDLGPTVSPMPVTAGAFIRLNSSSPVAVPCTIFDASGKTVARFEIPSGNLETSMPVSGLNSGSYTVVLKNGTQMTSVPFVVSR